MTKNLTGQEKKDFQDMITACGRNPTEYVIDINATSGAISIQHTVSGKTKEYSQNEPAGWIITFATDIKMGEI